MFRQYRVLLTTGLFASALLAQSARVAGNWEAHATHEGRSQTWTFKFDVKGDSFTGTWQSLGSDVIRQIQAGKIKGDHVSFKTLRKDGRDGVLFTGTVAGDAMELEVNNLGEGERSNITALRKNGTQ
jgi:phage head maturation protease